MQKNGNRDSVASNSILKAQLMLQLPFQYANLEHIANRILRLKKQGNFLQIMYDYQIDALQVLMKHALEIEDYETCYQIHTTVELDNKARGVNNQLLPKETR